MAMTTTERAAFVDAYTKVLLGSWSDEAYAERVRRHPRSALGEAGYPVAAGSDLRVVESLPEGAAAVGDGDGLATQIRLWEEGRRNGAYVLVVPPAPALDASVLADDDLAGISGGMSCCCCPCSCCTA